MKKSELQEMSVDVLRKKASELKIKNYIKLPKVELIEKIYGLLSSDDGINTLPVIAVTEEELFSKRFSELKKNISLKDGSEVAFTDYVGEKHIGVIIKKDGIKYKIKAEDDNIIYTMATSKIEGANEFLEENSIEETQSTITDKMNRPLKVGQRCRVRREGVWSEGTIIEFKEIQNEDYVHIQVDGVTLPKLVNTADIIGLSEGVINNPASTTLKTTDKSMVKVVSKPAVNSKVIAGFEVKSHIEKYEGIDFKGLKKGDEVSFISNKIEKKGFLRVLFWDTQVKEPCFLIRVGDKDCMKKVSAILEGICIK